MPSSWTLWTSWSSCSQTCGPEATRRRSRIFTPGRHGGNTAADGDLDEVQYCAEKKERPIPTPCPIPARKSSSQWESWSACTETCYPEGSQPPMIERKRECIPATLVDTTKNKNHWTFNRNINNCSNIMDVTENKQCDIKPCPGEYTISSARSSYSHPDR